MIYGELERQGTELLYGKEWLTSGKIQYGTKFIFTYILPMDEKQ